MKNLKLLLLLAATFLAVWGINPGRVAAQSQEAAQLSRNVPHHERGKSIIVRNTPQTDANGAVVGYTQELIIARPPAPRSKVQLRRKNARRAEKGTDSNNDEGGPQFFGCNSTATVSVLANELTYGAGGPQVPTRLDLVIDGGTPVGMFGGSDVAPFMEEQISLVFGETLSFIGKSAYPNFDEPFPWISYTVPSDDAVNAAILVNGANFFTIAAQKGISAVPFGMQQSLATILGSRVNWDTGLITMPEEEIIVLFELGASSPASPAFDFNDLVLSITTVCENGSEVVLRDSIGPDITLTNGGRVIPNTATSSDGIVYIAFNLSPLETVSLREVSMVVGSPVGSFPPIIWEAFDYQVRVWSSPQARVDSPRMGDLLNCDFPFPSNFPSNGYSPPVFGSAIGIAPFNIPTTSHLLAFNLLEDPNISCPPAILQSGGIYPVAIQSFRPTFVNTGMGIVTSFETGVTDVRYTDTTPEGIPITDYSTVDMPLTGRVGYKAVGISQ